MAHIQLQGVSKHFGETIAVNNLSMEIHEGEFVSLLGPSGCGKTTTLRIAAGLETPTEGEVVFDGERVTHLSPAERNIAMVFQLRALYPHMSVRANVAFPLRAERLPRAEIAARVERAAKWMRIEHVLDKMPAAVHPADAQRAAIAKAIARDPALFLFDEPFSRLDAQLRAEMRVEIKRVHSETGRAAAFVTHDQTEALAISDRVAVMRQGELVQIGTPAQIFDAPNERYVAEFVGSPPINMLEAELTQESGGLRLRIADQSIPAADMPLHGWDGPSAFSGRAASAAHFDGAGGRARGGGAARRHRPVRTDGARNAGACTPVRGCGSALPLSARGALARGRSGDAAHRRTAHDRF